MEDKKDFKPIIIYLVGSVGVAFLLGFVLGLFGYDVKETDKVSLISSIVAYIGLAIVFVILYRKRLSEDIKRFTKKDLLLSLLFGVVTLAGNYLLSMLFPEEIENQELVIDMLQSYKVLGSLSTVICAPIVEEFVFRYSLDTLFKNKWVFLAVSAIAFGLFHVIGLQAIIYVYLGVMFGIVYLKTNKNVVSPMIVHIINNLFAVLSVFFGF